MSLFEQFETDKTKEQDGVPVEYAPNTDGTIPVFYLARIGGANSKYSLLIKKLTKQYKRQIQLDSLPDEKLMEISIQACVVGKIFRIGIIKIYHFLLRMLVIYLSSCPIYLLI